MTQRGLIIDADIDATDLPTTTLSQRMLARASLTHWFQPDASLVTLGTGTAIASFIDRKAGGQTLAQATAAKQATLVDASFGDYASALFDQSASQNYALSGTQPDWSGAFSFAIAFKFDDTAVNKALFGRFTSSSIRALLLYDGTGGTNSVNFYVNGPHINVPASLSGWNVLVVGHDGENIRARVNGAEVTPVDSGPLDPGTATLNIGSINGAGQFWDGNIGDVLTYSGMVLDDTAAMADLVEYFDQVYGLTL